VNYTNRTGNKIAFHTVQSWDRFEVQHRDTGAVNTSDVLAGTF
jgi:hypothetical protein